MGDSMKKIPFSLAMQLLTLLKKMQFNFNMDVDLKQDEEAVGNTIMQKIMEELILKLPTVQDEFIDLLNKLAGTEYTTESDTFDIILTVKQEYTSITQAFTQALKLKSIV
jgi:hypothetical protein